jgi:hypothetical protein
VLNIVLNKREKISQKNIKKKKKYQISVAIINKQQDKISISVSELWLQHKALLRTAIKYVA